MSRAMTGTPLVDLDTPLVGPVGKKAADALAAKLDLHTVGDLVRHYPRRYVDRGKLTEIAGLELGEHVTVLAEVEKVTMRECATGAKLMQVVITDGRGHGSTARSSTLQAAEGAGPGPAGAVRRPGRPVPGQRSSPTRSSSRSRRARASARSCRSTRRHSDSPPGRSAAACARCSSCWRTPRTPFRRRGAARRPIRWGRLFAASTGPTSMEEVQQAQARVRYRRGVRLQVALAQRRRRRRGQRRRARDGPPVACWTPSTPGCRSTSPRVSVGSAPTSPTSWRRSHPMHRLLQGEVGSGKTVVALRAMLPVVDAGGQAALLAPTEVLASQHHARSSACSATWPRLG